MASISDLLKYWEHGGFNHGLQLLQLLDVNCCESPSNRASIMSGSPYIVLKEVSTKIEYELLNNQNSDRLIWLAAITTFRLDFHFSKYVS